MRSPFPGMDPYLEGRWADIHHRLITYATDALHPQLPGDLRARIGERTVIETVDSRQAIYPDVRVIERPARAASAGGPGGGTAVLEPAAPVLFDIGEAARTEGFIEIVDTGSGYRVVTVVEVLSPANKGAAADREAYLHKQEALRQGGVSLVEIDLLRAGTRVQVLPETRLPPDDRTPYRVCVVRAWRPRQAAFYPIELRRRLPVIPIPLREHDPEPLLDLQALLDQAYERGGWDDLDYSRPPEPPLEPGDEAWADALLREAGRRV
jgi:hypothetical protein